MAKRITLQGVANSLGQSFTSLMNYWGDDYVLGHIITAAWATGGTQLRTDLVAGTIDPSPLLVPPVKASLDRYIQWFPRMVQRSNSSLDLVSSAELLVTVEPNQRRPYKDQGHQESPFTCTVSIVDDQGREYRHEVRDWWFPEAIPGPGSPS